MTGKWKLKRDDPVIDRDNAEDIAAFAVLVAAIATLVVAVLAVVTLCK